VVSTFERTNKYVLNGFLNFPLIITFNMVYFSWFLVGNKISRQFRVEQNGAIFSECMPYMYLYFTL